MEVSIIFLSIMFFNPWRYSEGLPDSPSRKLFRISSCAECRKTSNAG